MAADRAAGTGSGSAWASQDVASGWQSGAAARGATLGPATDLMLDRAGVVPGSRVLDLGAGTGDQTLVAARRVGSEGLVLATDISAAVLDLAREAAVAAGLSNVETRVMDAERLDLDDDSFDAVIARLSLQFIPNLELALAEVRRVLRPGGKLAGLVFSSIERNAYRAVPQGIASRIAGRPFPEPGPGQFALNDPETLTAAFEQAGFHDVGVEVVSVTWHFPSLDAALDNLRAAQPLLMKILADLSPADQARTWDEIRQALGQYAGPDGFAGPGEYLVVAGTA
jgi:SAM-dependent methyltransferase